MPSTAICAKRNLPGQKLKKWKGRGKPLTAVKSLPREDLKGLLEAQFYDREDNDVLDNRVEGFREIRDTVKDDQMRWTVRAPSFYHF